MATPEVLSVKDLYASRKNKHLEAFNKYKEGKEDNFPSCTSNPQSSKLLSTNPAVT